MAGGVCSPVKIFQQYKVGEVFKHPLVLERLVYDSKKGDLTPVNQTGAPTSQIGQLHSIQKGRTACGKRVS